MFRQTIFLVLGVVFTLMLAASAKPGDKCTTPQGSGTCMKTSACAGSRSRSPAPAGFSVAGYCPDDPDDVRCCVQKECKGAGSGNLCIDKSVSSCEPGGALVRNQCPGGNNIQCCVRDSKDPPPPGTGHGSTPPPPSKPKCETVTINPTKIEMKEFIFNRAFTKKAESPTTFVNQLISSIPFDPLAPIAGIAGWLAFKAGECADKNQCFALEVKTLITRCVGNQYCC